MSLAPGKLFLFSPWPLPPGETAALRAQHPGLEVEVYTVPWPQTQSPVPADGWKDVTVLLTGSCLPEPGWAPRLKYVQLFSAGANHISQHPVFREAGVAFCGANGVHGPQIAEWVIATYLSAKHRLPYYRQLQDDEVWRQGHNEMDLVEDAVGRCIGILGYGAIGRQTARLARALGMTVHACTLKPRDTPESRHDDVYTPAGLGDADGSLPDKWFSSADRAHVHAFLDSGLDLLVVAVPLTDRTRGLLGPDEFALLAKRRTYLANVARGPIVDTDALVAALNDGRISGAALDVTDPEPLPRGHPLWTAKNATITPHVSGSSTRYFERVLAILHGNLDRLAAGQPLQNELDKEAGYRF